MFSISVTAADVTSNVTEKFSALQNLKIIDNISQSLEDNVTRAEFVSFAVNMLNIDIVQSDTVFMDVTKEHWASGYINYAEKLGVISKSSRAFYPEDDIKYAEAVKILLGVLGYGEICELNGGYPNGYFNIANTTGLLKNVKYADNETMDYYAAAELIYNCLTIPMADAVYSEQGVKFDTERNRTILDRYFKAVKLSGIITGTKDTTLNGISSLKDGEIELYDAKANKYYRIETTIKNTYTYLGKRVDCYVEIDTNELISISLGKQNNTLNIDSELISNDTTKDRLYYYEDNRKVYAEISPIADMVYNKRGMASYTKNDLLIENGEIILLDNNDDEMYDVIFVNSYSIIVVGKVDNTNEFLYDKFTSSVTSVAENSPDYELQIIKGGQDITLDAIKENDIVFCYDSINEGKKLKVLSVSGQIVTETITEYGNDYINAGSYVYEFTSYFERNRNKMAEIKMGSLYNLYIDNNGKLIAVDTNNVVKKNYAYLYKTDVNTDLDNTRCMKIFNRDGEWLTVDLKNKIKLNGTVKKLSDVITKIENAVGQVVVYELDNDGKLASLEISDSSVSNEFAAQNNIFHMHNNAKNTFRKTDTSFDSYTFLDSNTILFFLPENLDDTELYYIGGPSDLYSGVAYTYQSYDENLYKVAGAAVIEYDVSGKANSSMLAESSLFTVEKVVKCIAEDEECYKICGLRGKEKVEYIAYSNTGAGNLNGGDVIQILLNGKGYISKLEVIHDNSSNFINTSVLPSSLYKARLILKGDVVRVDPVTKRMIIEENVQQGVNISSTSLVVHIYNTQNDSLQLGSISNIMMGDYVIMRINISMVRDIVIIR